ncbi:MAG: UDP-N-acetylglucosamine 2-epimerase (non-hydrolyzing) [Desulfobacca sp. 4484_104]|nr:MAG: UDP-N-acetylglucosamine 2-epimerase (non-hydrolyzing) [Desulfobacca sp. 4484_104]
MKVLLVAGARPNFMKIAPLYHTAAGLDNLQCLVVHTGQHYDYEMSQAFFDDLELPKPDFFLNAGSGSHAVQTAKIMVAFEAVCQEHRPDLVLVVGDVNSTLACSIVAKKMCIEVAHVEAGLRSFDLSMPEEINRMVTDAISDYFFVTEPSGVDNLLREGKPREAVHLVGHVMIDNLLRQVEKLQEMDTGAFATREFKDRFGERGYVFLTLHRPSNVDDREVFAGIVTALNEIATDCPILFPVHPRTAKMLETFGLELSPDVIRLPPLGFRESLFLWRDAVLVLTDSGGLQEETTALGVPCITLRQNTERPITVEQGSNILAGSKTADILAAYRQVRANGGPVGQVPLLWDGKAAERIWDILR